MKIKHTHARYIQGESVVRFHKYGNGRAVIQLVDPEDGCPNCTATVNVPEVDVPDGYVLIKDWSENDGVMGDLIDAGIIDYPEGVVPCGFVEAHLCKVL